MAMEDFSQRRTRETLDKSIARGFMASDATSRNARQGGAAVGDDPSVRL
jgi:hypothetical protein